MAPVREGTLSGGLPYYSFGDGPPLVLIAGLTMTHENPRGLARWLEQQTLRPFAPHFTVYAVNRRPGLAPGTTIADIAADYATALGDRFEGPLDIVGFSTGGSVALQFAIDHPQLVRHLVVASSACRLSDQGRAAQLRVAELARAGDQRGEYRELSKPLVKHPVMQEVSGWGAWLLGPWMMGRHDDPTDMIVTIEAEDVFDATPDLHRIAAPTLVVGGDRDGFYSPEIFRATADGIPNARLCLYEGKGHVGALGKRFAADTMAFLRETA
jgi:pimeloyl-ACP methyl ester carboxylesterase